MHIFFSVGEPSGDHHAALLIRELKARDPDLQVSGLGGSQMQQAGCQLDYRLTDLAVMGLLRVIPLLWRFCMVLHLATRILRDRRPDAVVLVDFPGFNWWIARRAKALGIRVFYYLPPQLWAWAPWRVRRVRKHVDHVLCALPFEKPWYAERGVVADYVGHPFLDEVTDRVLDEPFMEQRRAVAARRIGLLPGSRNQEVELNWPIMLACMRRVADRLSDVSFQVACFNETHRRRCQEMLAREPSSGRRLPIELFVGKTAEVIETSDCCLMVSGSVSLEMLARKKPAIVVYYCTWLFGVVAKWLVKCKYASLPNLIADEEVLPEFFPQGDGRVAIARISDLLVEWLTDSQQRQQVADQLHQLYEATARPGASAGAADVILEQLRPLERSRAA